MDNPTIADAKALATRYRKHGVIIFDFNQTSFHAASYGFSRSWCDSMKLVVEQIAGLIEAGVIEIPDRCERFDTMAESGEDAP